MLVQPKTHIRGAFLIAIFLFSLLIAFPSNAKDEKRVALVIGNSAYAAAPLRNPANDASDMAATLQDLGFKVVHHQNLNQRQTLKAVRQFGRALSRSDVGLFYYAGHGMEVNDRNYLIPIDADIESEDEVEFEGIDVGRVLRKMESAGNAINVMILDACRNNPLERSFRSGSRGLARMDAPIGSFLLYSTAPGKVAADGRGRNGLFTRHLIDYLKQPGLSLRDVALNTRREVMKDSNYKQVPWESSSLIQSVVFNPKKIEPEPVAANKPEIQTPAPEPNPEPVAELKPEPVEKSRLIVETRPGNARVRVMNIGPKYYPGIELEKGKAYDILVSAEGFESYRGWLKVTEENQELSVALKKMVQKRLPFEPKMVEIKGGWYRMGDLSGDGYNDEKPVHAVEIKPFLIGKYEVTFDEYDAYVRDTGVKRPSDKGWGRGKRPVINVSWEDSQGYINWLNKKTGKKYRLPSESEWEFVARAGSTTKYSWGDKIGTSRANCYRCGSRWDNVHTAPVGSFKANQWGVNDMHGNVREWVEDKYQNNYKGAPGDGSAWTDSSNYRVLRGGSWSFSPSNLSSANRNSNTPYNRDNFTGFRLAHDL